MTNSARTLLLRLMPPCAVGAACAIAFWRAEVDLLAPPPSDATDTVLLAALFPAKTMAVATLLGLLALHVVLVLPLMRRFGDRIGLQLASAVLLAVIASQVFAVIFFAAEVDTWFDVSAVGLFIAGLPVLLLAMLTVAVLRTVRGAP